MSSEKNLFNQIPSDSELLKRYTPLQRGQTVKYRLAGSYDPKTKQYRLRDCMVPSTDVVVDPKTGETYDIAYIKNMGVNGKPNFGEIWFEQSGMCMFVLNGSSANHQSIHKFIELSNYLIDNPFRDVTKPALIERVADGADAKRMRVSRRQVMDAISVLDAMSDADILKFLKDNGMPTFNDEETRRNFLEEYIEKGNHAKFMNSSSGAADVDSQFDVVAKLKKDEKITYDSKSRQWISRDGYVLLSVKKGANPDAELAVFLSTKEGKETLELIG